MNEIFDIIIAVNRLKEQVKELNDRINNICKDPSQITFSKNLDEAAACKILKVSPDQIYRMRKRGEIEFIRYHRKILYPTESLHKYLDAHMVKPDKEDTG
jgi:excisionase family DNA binding protein